MLSPFEAFLIRASRLGCLDGIIQAISIRDVLTLAKCSDPLRSLITRYQSTTWDINNFLSHWTYSPSDLRSALCRADAIITGPALFHFLNRSTVYCYGANLHVICRIEGVSPFSSFLAGISYERVASVDRHVSITTLMTNVAIRDTDDTWGLPNMDDVLHTFVFESTDHPGVDCGPLPNPTIILKVVDADPRKMIFKEPTSEYIHTVFYTTESH